MLQLYPIGYVQQLLQVQCPSSVLVIHILSIYKYMIYICINLTKSWQQIPEGGFFSWVNKRRHSKGEETFRSLSDATPLCHLP